MAYTVANYPVEATAGNAVAAKQQALADGQQAAFRSLLKRIVPVTAYKQLTRISNVKAADLVSGVTVRSERNSATAYIANLDFSFQPDGVRSLLSQQGIPFVDEQAAPVTVVTASLQGEPAKPANDNGVWHRAWTGLDLDHTITPVSIAAGGATGGTGLPRGTSSNHFATSAFVRSMSMSPATTRLALFGA